MLEKSCTANILLVKKATFPISFISRVFPMHFQCSRSTLNTYKFLLVNLATFYYTMYIFSIVWKQKVAKFTSKTCIESSGFIFFSFYKQNLYLEQCFYAVYTLQMFTGIYRGPAGKLECGDFRIAGFTCISAFSINSVGVPFMDFAGKL